MVAGYFTLGSGVAPRPWDPPGSRCTGATRRAQVCWASALRPGENPTLDEQNLRTLGACEVGVPRTGVLPIRGPDQRAI